MNKINFNLISHERGTRIYKAKVVLTPHKGFSPKLKERDVVGYLNYSEDCCSLRVYHSIAYDAVFYYECWYHERSVLAYKRALAEAMRLVIRQITLDGTHYWQSQKRKRHAT